MPKKKKLEKLLSVKPWITEFYGLFEFLNQSKIDRTLVNEIEEMIRIAVHNLYDEHKVYDGEKLKKTFDGIDEAFNAAKNRFDDVDRKLEEVYLLLERLA